MRQSETFLHTLRDAPTDAEVPSHRLLSQAGFISKLGAGLYSYTPAMWRVLKKISAIVREEMDRAGGQEVMLPIVQPKEVWEESGRWDRYVADGIMFNFKDRKDAELCLGPTHEEIVTTLVKRFVNSYKQLPVNLYQLQTKFRDEIRPRFGLMRCREFIMKDAYSFDVNEEAMQVSYAAMSEAYHRIAKRLGLDYRCVDADAGAIGGSGSQEFMVLAENGEDTLLFCDKCDYASNQEKAESIIEEFEQDPKMLPMEEVEGKGLVGVEALAEYLKIPVWKTTKTILFMADSEAVAVMVRGDCEVNEIKVRNALDANELRLATAEEVKELTGAEVGYAGPIGLPENVRVLADKYVAKRPNFECGANRTDFHNINVNFGRDVPEPEYGDFKLAKAGERCTKCEGSLQEAKGIEIGHIFQLGTKYSEALDAKFTDENGRVVPFVMGCYGIGVSRIAASAVEQRHDDNGIIWPLSIAPWHVHLICVNPKKEDQKEVADSLYDKLDASGVEVLYDDRKASAGVKFNDADLIGLPIRIVVGRDASEGSVEFGLRNSSGDREKVNIAEVLTKVEEQIAQ